MQITNSEQLMSELRRGNGRLELAAGSYYLDVFPPQSVTLTGEGVFDTRLYILATPQFQQQSNLTGLTFIVTDENIPLLNIDRMAHSVLNRVWFVGSPYADNNGKDWSEVKHKGQGIVNPKPDGDNNYRVTLNDCYFYGLDEAISLHGNPKEKRDFANALWFQRCIWNACRTGIYLDRVGESYFGWCNAQCCEYTLVLRGNSNLIDRFHIERGRVDVTLLQNSYYNEFNLYCDPKKVYNVADPRNENAFVFLKQRRMMKL